MLNNCNFLLFSSYLCNCGASDYFFFQVAKYRYQGNELKASKFKECISKSLFLTCALSPSKKQ